MAFSKIDRAALRQQLEEFIDQCEVAVTDDLVENLLTAKLQPLLDKLQEFETRVSPPVPVWGRIVPFQRTVRCSTPDQSSARLAALDRQSGAPSSSLFNPYEAPAGRDLDARVHLTFMRETSDPALCPRYSTDMRDAREVLRRLRQSYSRPVICGRTTLADRSWFVRAMTDSQRGTEVLAESLPLAICRLAAIRGAKAGPGFKPLVGSLEVEAHR
ncbi:MAG: hypothetical protein AB9869_21455 [Verrucomicrobiia bacterium]